MTKIHLVLSLLIMSVTTSWAQYENPLPKITHAKWFSDVQELQLNPGPTSASAAAEVSGDIILYAGFRTELSVKRTGWRLTAQESKYDITIARSSDGTLTVETADGAQTARKKHFTILQVEVRGQLVHISAAHPGEPLQQIAQVPAPPSRAYTAMLFAEGLSGSHVNWFNIRISKPVREDFDAEKDGYPASRLETMDITSGERKIIHQYEHRFEAPNFMPDGKSLLFNQDGLLYTIPVNGGQPKVFPTGFANRNNNDHGISFDGKWLAISHHRDGMPDFGSTVYIMPLASTGSAQSGVALKMITAETPSYWHGWSADGKKVYYVAKRGTVPQYHIYSNTIDGNSETRLTDHASGHVDGPESTPDGKWIYYNGNSTGTMQIWRMRPDGSGKEQITFDEYNNWFPHISPDGKWIAYLAFLPDINPDDHPAYKHVTLRLMPASGGAPKVLAHLYGGQGTINVPSWSPDSRTIAFVSYTSK